MHLVHVTYRIFASNALGNKSPIFLMIMKPTPMLSSTSKTKLNKKIFSSLKELSLTTLQ